MLRGVLILVVQLVWRLPQGEVAWEAHRKVGEGWAAVHRFHHLQ
jgi:hypothetical protein